jgi:MFS family permease
MDAMLALVSSLIIPLSAFMMLDALSDRRYREVALFIVMTIVMGVIYYLCISELPDPDHFPWYWKAAFPVGLYFGTIFVLLFVFNSNNDEK